MPNKIYVGYTLTAKASVDVEEDMPVFTVSKTFKEETAKAKIAEKESEWRANHGTYLYTGEFAAVHIIDPQVGKIAIFRRGEWADLPMFQKHRKSEQAPWSVALQVRHYLVTTHGRAWSDNLFERRPDGPEAVFIGFNVKRFLKFLGLECALAGSPLPLTMWYGNSDHRDMESAIVPTVTPAEPSGVTTLDVALRYFEDAGAFLAEDGSSVVSLPESYVLHADAELDAVVAFNLAVRLGMTERDPMKLQETAEPRPAQKKKRVRPQAVQTE